MDDPTVDSRGARRGSDRVVPVPRGPTTNGAVRVVLLGGSRLFVDGLESALMPYPQVRLVATVTNEELAGGRLIEPTEPPEVLLLDHLSSPGPDAAEVQRLRQSCPAQLVVTSLPEDPRKVLAWAELGARGLLSAEAGVDDLVRTLSAVSKGEAACSPSVTAMLLDNLRRTAVAVAGAGPAEAQGLTPRERQVARRLECGLSNKEIARELGITLSTVKNHVHNILTKLEIANRGRVRTLGPEPGSRPS